MPVRRDTWCSSDDRRFRMTTSSPLTSPESVIHFCSCSHASFSPTLPLAAQIDPATPLLSIAGTVVGRPCSSVKTLRLGRRLPSSVRHPDAERAFLAVTEHDLLIESTKRDYPIDDPQASFPVLKIIRSSVALPLSRPALSSPSLRPVMRLSRHS